MNQKDLVSIVVRTKDRPILLGKALATLRDQSYRPLQVVLVNDGGELLDEDALRGHLADVELLYVPLEKNIGRAAAGNVGLREAQGRYVGFLDDDDELCPKHVEMLWTVLQEVDYKIAYADSEMVFRSFDPATQKMATQDRRLFASRDFSGYDLLVENFIPLNSLLFERQILLDVEGFDEAFELYEDWDLLIRCAAKQPFYHVGEVTSKYIQWSAQMQIAQSPETLAKTDSAYYQVLQKHWAKFDPFLIKYIRDFRKQNNDLKDWLQAQRQATEKAENQLFDLIEQKKELQAVLDDLKQQNDTLKQKSDNLDLILSSNGWKWLSRYYKIKDFCLPEGSSRLRFVQLLKYVLRNPGLFVKACNKKNLKDFFSQVGRVDSETLLQRMNRKLETTRRSDLNRTFPELSGDQVFAEPIESLLEKPGDEQEFLVIDRGLPAFDKDSGGLRMFQIVVLLGELGYRVTFAADDGEKISHYHDSLTEQGVKVVYDAAELLEREGSRFRYVLLSRPEQAYLYLPLVRAYAVNCRVIYDTVDLHWVRFERGAEVNKDASLERQAREYKAKELCNAVCSDLSLTVTEDEKSILLQEDSKLNVAVLPNIHEAVDVIAPYAERRDLMFIGGFQHLPNEDSMVYFVNEVFPLIRKELPDVHLFIVGSHPTPKVKALADESVSVTGFVSDVAPYFEKSRVFVSPLRYGAGMKGKIGQSMSFGLPVVTTTIGAEGIGLIDGESALIADDPERFAAAVVRLYREEDLWQKISRESHDFLVRHYSREATKKTLQHILHEQVTF